MMEREESRLLVKRSNLDETISYSRDFPLLSKFKHNLAFTEINKFKIKLLPTLLYAEERKYSQTW